MRPLLAVWLDGALHFVAGASTRKARNLARDPCCVLTTAVSSLNLTVERCAMMVRDVKTLTRAVTVYATKYDWHATVRDGAFHADGAPTVGPPPYDH